jgi:hypothetical protein
MKKKYQIPESVSEKGYLRTSLLAGSLTNPTPTTDEKIAEPTPHQEGEDVGDARRRLGTNLMEF